MLSSNRKTRIINLNRAKAIAFALYASLTLYSPVYAADAVGTPDASISCINFLQNSGLQQVLDQVPQWIDAELANSKTFLATKPELSAEIKEQLTQTFVLQSKALLCANANARVGEANVELAGSRLSIPAFQELTALRKAVLGNDELFVEYQKKMRGRAPLESRQEWIRKLDLASGVTSFKTAIWGELRKTVLWMVGKSSGKVFTEAELDHELVAFQREATDRAQQETTEQWLYAYRAVPDAAFEQFYAVLDQAQAQKTAAAVLEAVGMMGREIRQ